MATKRALNFTLDTTTATNSFCGIWKLTRCMKAAGWTYKAAGCGSVQTTTIASGSNGQATPGSGGVINVASTSGFPTQGSFTISSIGTTINYTGITATTFTGCVVQSSSGTMATGQTVTSVKDTSANPSCDPWGGSADPMNDVYAGANQAMLDGKAAWWCAEGPSTVKIGIGTASSGTFLRGEIVTQATSGATGELLGYVLNAAGNSGWMVIMPQTGTFDGTHQLTGATSGATVTATSYNLFRRQIVFAKDTTVVSGYIFYECLSDTEIAASSNTALFSDLAANASNCNSTVAPGNSSSVNNRFPSYGICLLGTAESGGAATFYGNVGSGWGKAQIVAVNATPSAGVSADGTFWISQYRADASAYETRGFFRLDDSEPGDVDPFVGIWNCGSTPVLTTRTSSPNAVGQSYYTFAAGGGNKGYCARGTGTMGTGIDSFVGFYLGMVVSISGGVQGQFSNSSTPPKIRNHPDNAGTPPSPFEHVSVFSGTNNLTMRKGIIRWMGLMPTGSVGGTWDTINWLNAFAPSSSVVLVVGPLDGTTAIVNT